MRTQGPEPEQSVLKQAVTVSRLRSSLDGVEPEPSQWGVVDIAYIPTPELRFFNLSLGDQWPLRNVPVFPTLYQIDRYEQSSYFRLPDREEPDGIQVGYRITHAPLDDMPAATQRVRLHERSETYFTGVHDAPMGDPADAPPPFRGAPLADVVYCRLDYPNQPCGKNECGPTAVSNSLRWLNKTYGLGIPQEKLTINAWKGILGWAGDGVENGDWANRKVNYCNDKNNALPVDSTKLPGAHVAEALKQFKAGQAVEMFVGNHITALICMALDSDGNYVATAVSDAAQEGQDKPGKPVSQTVQIDANGRTTSGPEWAVGKGGAGLAIQNFVVQCPHPNKWKK